jgi:hypothetical protein
MLKSLQCNYCIVLFTGHYCNKLWDNGMKTPGNVSRQVNVPVMEKGKFADLVGVDVGVVNGWIDKGYLPSMKLGKHRLVNIALLAEECMDQKGQRHV